MRMIHSLCLLVLVVAALIAPLSARAAGPGLTPDRADVTAGDVITFDAEGFASKERLTVWATAPDQAVLAGNDVDADDRGHALVSFRVPTSAIGGIWAITAYGRTSRTQAVAQFTVTSLPNEGGKSMAWAAPESGPAGSTFRFAATGFNRRERVSYWFTAPDGVVFVAFSRKLFADTEGRVDLSWDVPADAPRGVWVVTIQGLKSNVARGITFRVQ